ncbi:hypothetical protein [Thiothrix caldifontis]|nr:hypothetical protein [Thiothrix caldifontis]
MQALMRFRQSNAGFADSIIAVESQQANMTLWTFDRKLSKQDGVQRLLLASLAEFEKQNTIVAKTGYVPDFPRKEI